MLSNENYVCNYPVTLQILSEVKSMKINGIHLSEMFLIFNSSDITELLPIFNDLMKNNTVFYDKMKQRYGNIGHYDISNDFEVYQEFTKLNNELDTMQRKLTRKNYQLNRQNEQLELINKILRHDLANIFSVILSGIRLIDRIEDLSYLNELKIKAKRGVDLINNMRNLYSINKESAQLVPVKLENVFNNLKVEYPELTISNKFDAEVLANDGLDSLFKNLVQNAYNHGEAQNVTISVEIDSDFVIITVSDDGIGIPDDQKGRIFDENYTFGKHANTGLGLYIVDNLIKIYKGKIQVVDNKPKGVSFIITLPKLI